MDAVNDPDHRTEIRDFLATRRARISPGSVGLPPGGGRRRVPGLRREEVAVLAGVSTDWYTRLEKGHISGVSDDVLEAVARALLLDEAERAYLFDLARAARPARRRARRAEVEQVPPRVQWMLDSVQGSAAIVANGRLDLVATNALGRALFSPLYATGATTPSFARFQFLDPTAPDFYPDWEGAAKVTTALLRTEAGRVPDDHGLRALVGELSTVSEDFRTRWAQHDVRQHHAGSKQFRHPDVGEMDLTYHTMDVSARRDRSLVMTLYTAEPGTPSAERLLLLASWAATHSPATRPPETRSSGPVPTMSEEDSRADHP